MARKAKTTSQAAPVKEKVSAQANTNKKRKAEDDLDSPRTCLQVEKSSVGAISRADQTVKPAEQSLSHSTQYHAGSGTGMSITKASGGEGSAVDPDKGFLEIKSKFVDENNTGGQFVTVETLQSEELLDIPSWGYTPPAGGSPTAAFISIKRKGIQYQIYFSISPKEERTLANECIDLLLKQDLFGIGDLLLPLCSSIFDDADNNPIVVNNVESFLQSSVIYLRLDTNTQTIQPHPVSSNGHTVDWAKFFPTGTPPCPSWKLSDVKSFRPHNATNMIYEVEFDNETEPLVFKIPGGHGGFVQEFTTLLRCEELNIRAPRIKALLGVGTNWEGFVMTKIQASFCLADYCSDSIKATLTDRKRWFQQISEAVQALHRVDHIWGDAKSANVLIDNEGNACLIDFEGGRCDPWVPAELVDTPAGDLHALEEFRKFLKLDE
ncbi:hypothetical protein BJY00DRAFT_310382 [Aspergillus carlsbadensis]|nr:hypothetical protein BJY00DRAFT_310382 [Aspergillus carlsbadensis]